MFIVKEAWPIGPIESHRLPAGPIGKTSNSRNRSATKRVVE
jgi:hypothetical protein